MSTESLELATRGRRFDAALWPPRRSSVIAKAIAPAVTLVALACSALPAAAQFLQQGQKLVGTGAVSGAHGANQGTSVALSADGNTALVGGASDNSGAGAAWVFTRSDGVWSQQGPKLVGTGAINGPYSPAQGASVALSGDGATALVGGPNDNHGVGAVWVFTRSDGVWSQQGAKLVGAGAIGGGQHQGQSVALSADGDTALVGGPADNYGRGAVWVFVRSSGVWTQQGSKLVGTGATGPAFQGASVALSADGDTALVGGPTDNPAGTTPGPGAIWVFTRSGGVWSQQGLKLVGTGATGNVHQGQTVALAGDGGTALVGGQNDSSNAGAAWVFTRSGGAWTQQGAKLVGTGGLNYAEQGQSVALSSDGNTALVGAHWGDAVWVFARSDGGWSQQGSKLVGTGAIGQASQGASVALSSDGNTALVGGVYDNAGAGAAWVFVSGVKLRDAAAAASTCATPKSDPNARHYDPTGTWTITTSPKKPPFNIQHANGKVDAVSDLNVKFSGGLTGDLMTLTSVVTAINDPGIPAAKITSFLSRPESQRTMKIEAVLKDDSDGGLSLTGCFTTPNIDTVTPIVLVVEMKLNMSDYMKDCRKAGVPLPPKWGNSKWKFVGTLPKNKVFASTLETTEVWITESPTDNTDKNPLGICYALPRKDGSDNIQLLGVICQGKKSSQACFWDNLDRVTGERIVGAKLVDLDLNKVSDGKDGIPLIVDVDGNTIQKGIENCTNCHRGDNVFIIHPGTFLQVDPNLSAQKRLTAVDSPPYRPVSSRPGWVNPSPTKTLVLEPCVSCHNIPELTKQFCPVLKSIVGRTMPLDDTEKDGDTKPVPIDWQVGYRDDVAKLAGACNKLITLPSGAPFWDINSWDPIKKIWK